MCCMAYVLYFIEQMDWVLVNSTDGVWSNNKDVLFLIALIILTFIFTCESMNTLSYISFLAMVALCFALTLVMWSATGNITKPQFDKSIELWKSEGLIYFFGTAIFAFEGNQVLLEVHTQALDKKNFKMHTVYATSIVLLFYLALGMVCYTSFAQFTKPFILANMEASSFNYFVQILYLTGILCTSPLLMVPVFKILETSSFYTYLPQDNAYFKKKTFARYVAIYSTACIAYFIPNLSMFLNFIGGINGVYILFILPICMYIKVFEKEISTCKKFTLLLIMTIGIVLGFAAVVASVNVMLFTDNTAGVA